MTTTRFYPVLGGGAGAAVTAALWAAGTQLAIRDNILSENGGSGINAAPNTLFASMIAGNTLKKNGNDGIEIGAQNSGHTIQNNTARSNGLFDCYDNSIGPGTAGTANEWIDNTRRTENQPALCS